MYFELLWKELTTLPQVIAIALGGSRASETYDDSSDYDVYVYCTEIPTELDRKLILEKYCSYMEIGNHFWELEDDCTLMNGIDVDIIYRDLDEFQQVQETVVEQGIARNGYTTCMWHNLLHCKILYDKSERLFHIKERFDVEYPSVLKDNIIALNMKLLHGMLPSYDIQIKKAILRNDMIAINHRITVFIETYFDILFAMNRLTHPGEKRMVEYLLKHATYLPERFEDNLKQLYRNLYIEPTKVMGILEDIIIKLTNIIELAKET